MAASFVVNLLFWTGVSIGGVVLAALVDVSGGEWLGATRDTGARLSRFLPISLVLVLLLLWRSADVYPWAQARTASGWFRPWLVFVRDGAAALAVYGCAFAYLRASQRARAGVAGVRVTRTAVVLLIVYAVGFSVLAVDLIMSLEPRWTSTLFPAYVFSTNVYAGTAALAAVAAWSPRTAATGRTRDFANLLVGLALFWAYLFWSQFLVIWYGNVTDELRFMTARIATARPLGWIVLAMCCAIPAIVLVPPAGKRAGVVRVVAVIVLVGLWLERWLLIAPGVPPASAFSVIGITVAFAALFFAAVAYLPFPFPN
jgi:hypothetical protein